ncbi:MAG: ATP-binding protein, partial [Thermoanaerobaculia bacterium]
MKALEAAVASDSPAHAYLFFGPEHVGRATAARRLAQALNCTGATPPCGECEQCIRIERGIHADVLTVGIEAVSEGPGRKNISEDQVDDVVSAVQFSAYEGRTRAVIFDPAHALSESAQNKLLLTLEEPPPHVVFVLIASDEEKLLETI